MNRERIQAAIELMKRAENLDMRSWQGLGISKVEAIDELHACGNTACFGGYLALSPEWKEAGGSTAPGGRPVFKGDNGHLAVAKYFECRSDEELQFIKGMVYGDRYAQWSRFYEKPWKEVTPQDVVRKLEQLLEMDQ